MLIDSHLHLDFDEFAPDRAAIMARAAAAGVEAYVTIGIRVRDSARVIAVAEAYDNVFCTVGTLPHFADEERNVTAEEIVALTTHPKVVGIGEAGLDRVFGDASWPAQQAVFAAHIVAAQQTQLPLVIHSVREDEAMAQMLRASSATTPFPFVIHAFSGGPLLAEAALELGGYFGFGGLLTYPGNDLQREIAAGLPDDRLLLETDSPSLAPAPLQDERNEPANIRITAELLARLRGSDVESLAAQCSANTRRLFPKAFAARSP